MSAKNASVYCACEACGATVEMSREAMMRATAKAYQEGLADGHKVRDASHLHKISVMLDEANISWTGPYDEDVVERVRWALMLYHQEKVSEDAKGVAEAYRLGAEKAVEDFREHLLTHGSGEHTGGLGPLPFMVDVVGGCEAVKAYRLESESVTSLVNEIRTYKKRDDRER